MEYMEQKAQDQLEGSLLEQAVNDERAAVVAFLRRGGDTVRGVWYSWDSEMNGYYRSAADHIATCQHLRG